MAKTDFKSLEGYFETLSIEKRKVLEEIRQAILEAIPDVKETISYQIPTFKLNGKILVHFAVHANHVGFYPTPEGIMAFEKELARYKPAKGSVKFPLDEPMPFDLITKIAKHRAKAVRQD